MPPRFFRGVLTALLLAVPLWALLYGLVLGGAWLLARLLGAPL